MKKRITIPKGYEDCDGGKCEKTQTWELDIPDTKPVVESVPTVEIQNMGATAGIPQQLQQQTTTMQIPDITLPKTKTYSNEELTNLMPPGVNYAMCEGDNCSDSKLQNKNLVTKFKSCPKCGCNNVPKNSSMCPCCGVDEPKDEDDKEDYWESSEIELKQDDED